MFKILDDVEKHYEQISLDLQNPNMVSNQEQYRTLMKKSSELSEVVFVYRKYKKIISDFESTKELLVTEKNEDLRSLAKEEVSSLAVQKEELENTLKILLLPKNPNDEKNVIFEIRAGAGGDEASLFAEELFRAYCYYADNRRWKVDIISIAHGNAGGCKEIIASISGDRVFSRLKYESGVHRVQRIPKTEAQGRVHTSTVTVAVLPEVDEVQIKIDPNDLRIDVYRSSGHGGQSVNTTDSAVRVTHIPTNLVVTCQDEKSQLKNKSKALKVLAARLQALEEEKAQKQASVDRLAQIGSGDRSERIRTYNFPQSRVTDHRIGLTTHALSELMSGSFEQVIDTLTSYFQAEALKKQKI